MRERNNTSRARAAIRWLRQLGTRIRELEERRILLNRPWEENFLHWSHDGGSWRLHGHLVPTTRNRCRSTTRSGWCPAQAGCSTDNAPAHSSARVRPRKHRSAPNRS
ncbi:hypothetical protein FHR84_000839 [Actinopolyspora biskrensis]|uniref:Uncharacterized protein n=1 Tax=Actinopolyspora biskrensis TaxID=1470178 RepID=A0A852YX70_9ACTN|nr:hypothetical protein [Actinopolyspora biskrensis]NYH77525.1 hypothetical protein [Actinopolyspora biskrensis]